jgi:hypothetical protein
MRALGSLPGWKRRIFPGLGFGSFRIFYFLFFDPAIGFGFREVFERAGFANCRDHAPKPAGIVTETREMSRYFSGSARLGSFCKKYIFQESRLMRMSLVPGMADGNRHMFSSGRIVACALSVSWRLFR